MRTLHWERFEEILDKSVIDKLGMNQYDLHGCSPYEVEQIINSRVLEVLPDIWEEPARWLIEQVNQSLHKNPTPREVINAANAIIRNADGDGEAKKDIIWSSPNEIIGSAFANERDQILSDLDAWPADYEEMTKAVIIFLKSRNYPFSCKTLARKNILTINHRKSRCCLIINTNRNHSAIGASFSAGTQFLHRNPGSSCLYLTDPRCIITRPTWGPAKKKKDEFLSAGGRILQPSEGGIARFYALYSLSCKITEGDIQIETEDGVRPITLNELTGYVGNRELFNSLITATLDVSDVVLKKKSLSEKTIHSGICEVLRNQSMHIMRADLLAQALTNMGISLSHEDLIIWCGDNADSFKILQSQQGSMIIATGKAGICTNYQ